MKLKYLSLFLGLVFSFTLSKADNPLKVEKYTLDNGLTVYLNVDKTMPSVQGMVVVKGGAKRDPKDATGIAHYFEHIMFKGTNEIGTINFNEEKVYLDSIFAKYDELALAASPEARLKIQKDINRMSIKAADYAIPNEFDKIINEMGGTGLNAGTSQEYIVYYNSVPSNQVNKWLEVYSQRFIQPVFRLFQSELETVYEEKNMYADNPMTKLMEEFSRAFYPNNPYGQQTILGTAEHLKNPSLTKMKEYFDTYYVANNMALILSGDINPEKIKPVIEEKFGRLKAGEKIEKLNIAEDNFKGRKQITKKLTPIKAALLGFRTIPKGHKDETVLKVLENILSNSNSTGILDELVNENKLMMTGIIPDLKEEIGGHYIIVVPKVVGQKTNKAEKYVMAQLEKVKNGEINDTLIEAAKMNVVKSHQRLLEDKRSRTYAIMDNFVYNKSWEEVVQFPSQVNKITKGEIVEVANKYFGENYLAFYSKTGFPKKDKVSKPPFEKVAPKNSDMKSEYAEKIKKMPTEEIPIRFIDFNNDIKSNDLKELVHLYYNPNPINNVFSLKLEYTVGTYSFPDLIETAQLIQYCGIGESSYKEFYQDLQLLGAELSAYADIDKFTLELTGLEQNLVPTLKLFSKFLRNPSSNTKHIKKIYQNAKAEDKLSKSDPATVARALKEYALYGKQSNHLNRLGLKDIKRLKSYELLTSFKKAIQYETNIHYCGQKSYTEVYNTLNQHLYTPKNPYRSAYPIEKDRNNVEENTIYFVNDKKAVQSQIHLVVEGEYNSKEDYAISEAFNEYFGAGMSSLIFQEVREFRSLAYSAYGVYKPAFYDQNIGHFSGFMSTQADKTTDAMDILNSLMTNMPEKPERIEIIKSALINSINTQRPSFRNMSSPVLLWKKQGYNQDPRIKRVEQYKSLDFDQLKKFYERNIKDKPITYVIVGNEEAIDMEKLATFGKIVPIEKDILFDKKEASKYEEKMAPKPEKKKDKKSKE